MTAKVVALTSLLIACILYIVATFRPNDPYFFIISSNEIIGLTRITVAAIAVGLAFQKRFYYQISHLLVGALAVILLTFSVVGFIDLPLDYNLSAVLKPADYIFSLQCGWVLAIMIATYRRGTHRLPRLARPRRNQLELFARLHLLNQ